MKKIICLITLMLTLCGCAFTAETNTLPSKTVVSEGIDDLWDVTISKYLEYDLWDYSEIYDAGHFLMIPLHYAIQSNNDKYINNFEDHFDRFISEGHSKIDVSNTGEKLSILHYYYLVSRYISLELDLRHNNDNVDYLANYLLDEIRLLWYEIPAWQWGQDPFPGGMKQRILWKLENKDVDFSYYRAMIDEELFVLAIAADLIKYFPDNQLLKEITDVTYQIFSSESYFDSEGRWKFQVGVWDNHPDYAYVGYDTKEFICNEKPLNNTSTDSSHFHRFPLWIRSFYEAYPDNSDEKELFEKIGVGLEKQFFDVVLKEPTEEFPYYRLTNFMNGNNGIYRWDYTTSKGDGYGPYELSGTFTIGWWSFLDGERSKKLYVDLANQYPLSEEAMQLYIGPNTTRDRNTYISDPNSYHNGYKKILALLASEIE